MLAGTLSLTLRGLGRSAYRSGLLPHHAVQSAAVALGRDLDAAERAAVMAGWRDERAEVWQ